MAPSDTRGTMNAKVHQRLEAIVARYHRPELIPPDPLQWVCSFQQQADREVVALIAALLAFGRVGHILQSVAWALSPLGTRPAEWLREADATVLRAAWAGWRHRWATGAELYNVLWAARGMLHAHGTLGAAWGAARRAEDADAHDTLVRWVRALDDFGLNAENSLMPRPERGSACKRLHLFLRWMVRQDAIDPGGWPDSPARLLVPLDVHMHRIARLLGLTRRRVADLKTAREVTAQFRKLDPQDPVRFDFALTRLPIHDRMQPVEVSALLRGSKPLPDAAKGDFERLVRGSRALERYRSSSASSVLPASRRASESAWG